MQIRQDSKALKNLPVKEPRLAAWSLPPSLLAPPISLSEAFDDVILPPPFTALLKWFLLNSVFISLGGALSGRRLLVLKPIQQF